jgi:DNA-binding response OmpR family regulator
VNSTACANAPSVDQVDSRRILVVDDDVSTARAIRVILSSAGYQPTLCHAGGEALAEAGRASPAAALVDIHLPDLSGLILAQKLRAMMGPDRPIIVVSGDTSMETLNSLSHVGATYFLSKPMNVGTLLERLKAWLA